MDIYALSARRIRELIHQKEISAIDITKAFLGRIESIEDRLHAFVFVNKEGALDAAARIDQRIGRGEILGALAGVPIAIKDNICIKGLPATCSSKILDGFVSPYNASVVDKLLAQDAILIGKTNMDEFAMGSSTETSFFGFTGNPWNTSFTPGGSSGGSAAAVSARETPLSLGSDTGGSIRQPASFCGIVGLKPTYGRVSRYGLIAFASSLDQIGPFAWNVEDCALAFKVISGHDPKDSTSVKIPISDHENFISKGLKNIRIGMPKEYFSGEGIDPQVQNAVKRSIGILNKLGAEIIDISLPHTEYAIAAYYIVASSEASANLARYDGVKYGFRSKDGGDLLETYEKTRGIGFGKEVKRRIMLGTYALSSGYYDAFYLKAQKVRALIKRDFDKAFSKVDVIVTPTSPTGAFRIGEKIDNPLQMYLSDIYTSSANLAGLPGISMLCGFNGQGLPIGIQFIGKAFDEEFLLNTAFVLEKEDEWHLKNTPKI